MRLGFMANMKVYKKDKQKKSDKTKKRGQCHLALCTDK